MSKRVDHITEPGVYEAVFFEADNFARIRLQYPPGHESAGHVTWYSVANDGFVDVGSENMKWMEAEYQAFVAKREAAKPKVTRAASKKPKLEGGKQ